MKMEITKQNMMTKDEMRAHLYAPCPICGKINAPYKKEKGLFRTKYLYRCTDSAHTTEVSRHSVNNVRENGCECEWNIKIRAREEFKKCNLRLTTDEVKVLHAIGVVKIEDINKAHDKQRRYWNTKYGRK